MRKLRPPKRRKGNRPPRPEKVKDIIESILPAKRNNHRASVVFKRLERRKVRVTVRNNLSTLDTEGYTDKDLYIIPWQSENVRRRRDADNLSAFMRWAHYHTEGMDYQDSLSYIRKYLPRNVIGDHAYSHWVYEVRRKFNRRFFIWEAANYELRNAS